MYSTLAVAHVALATVTDWQAVLDELLLSVGCGREEGDDDADVQLLIERVYGRSS